MAIRHEVESKLSSLHNKFVVAYECPIGNFELFGCLVLIKWLNDYTLNYAPSHQFKPQLIVLDNMSNCVIFIRLHIYYFLLSDYLWLNSANRINLLKILNRI